MTGRKPALQRWEIAPEAGLPAVQTLAQALKISDVAARLLVARGLGAPPDAEAFMARQMSQLHDPALLPDIGAAVARIAQAIAKKEFILLFGDYDADGVTSTALLALYFEFLNRTPALRTRVEAMVPERHDGYGLSDSALREIIARKPGLLITLDNGISAVAQIAVLKSEGIDCIVVDHHLPGAELPPAVAVIDPKREDAANTYPFRELCGAGLSFKLAWALSVHFSNSKKVTPEFRAFLLEAMALAAVGTVADVVPLVDENRVLVHHGLGVLAATRNPGLKALLEVAALLPLEKGKRERISPGDIGFRLGPRLNAAGRCGHAADALALLLTPDSARATELAAQLERYNIERQKLEETILGDARAQALATLEQRPQARGFVLFSEHWHQGVIGIAASRIVDEFHRPALLLAINKTKGLAHGSGRSIRALNLHEALTASSAQLTTFGGHAAAAGMTCEPLKIDAFRIDFEAALLRLLPEEALVPRLHIDCLVSMREVTTQLCHDLERFEPCGMGNPRATLAVRGVEVPSPPKLMGRDEKHISFYGRQALNSKRIIGFNFAVHFHTLCDLAQRSEIDIACRPQLNTFNGQTNVELLLEDFRLSQGPSA